MSFEKRGFVLVAVLGAMLLVAALIFAAVFATTLDAMAARSAARATTEGAALQGALGLAAAELVGGGWPPPKELGPWPRRGVPARVSVSEVGPGTVHLVARLGASGPAPRAAQLVLQLEPELVVRWRP